MSGTAIHRFFGGSPLAVVVRLVFLSMVVGALLIWLDIDPAWLLRSFERVANQIWAMGFDAVRELGRYVAAGALVVVPIWFLARLFSFGGAR